MTGAGWSKNWMVLTCQSNSRPLPVPTYQLQTLIYLCTPINIHKTKLKNYITPQQQQKKPHSFTFFIHHPSSLQYLVFLCIFSNRTMFCAVLHLRLWTHPQRHLTDCYAHTSQGCSVIYFFKVATPTQIIPHLSPTSFRKHVLYIFQKSIISKRSYMWWWAIRPQEEQNYSVVMTSWEERDVTALCVYVCFCFMLFSLVTGQSAARSC